MVRVVPGQKQASSRGPIGRQATNQRSALLVSIHETNTRRIHGVQQPSRLESTFVRFASRVVVPTYRWCVRFFRGVGVTQHS